MSHLEFSKDGGLDANNFSRNEKASNLISKAQEVSGKIPELIRLVKMLEVGQIDKNEFKRNADEVQKALGDLNVSINWLRADLNKK